MTKHRVEVVVDDVKTVIEWTHECPELISIAQHVNGSVHVVNLTQEDVEAVFDVANISSLLEK